MKAAIFDVDGTLVDSVDLHTKAWQKAFRHFGHDIAFQEIRAQIGKGGDQLMPVFLSSREIQEKGEEIEEFQGRLFRNDYLGQVKPFPMVRALFARLIVAGWKLALASSAKGQELQTYKRICEITDQLDAETSSDDAPQSKPHPDIFQAAIKRLGNISPTNCIVIGDSPYDAEAAGKAGIRSVGFLSGGFDIDLLREAGCERIYRHADDLFQNFEDSIFYHERPPRPLYPVNGNAETQ